MIRSFHCSAYPAEIVANAKRGRTVSVVLPARNEETTVAGVVRTIRHHLMERHAVVDELVVIDDGSTDATAATAAEAGARVVTATEVLPEYGTEHGKGQAAWRGVHVTGGDIVVFCDTDVVDFPPEFVLGLVGPLLDHDDVAFVKGFYRRSYRGQPGEGGRVTELVARPLISLLFPQLAPLVQPLAGEFAARRDVLESVPFVGGYGVDLGLLIDVAARCGASAIAQCDLGERVHRNRPLSELSPQAMVILQLALDRAGLAGTTTPWGSLLLRHDQPPLPVTLVERPPLMDVPAHRKTA
jgi:glucosyl-3-phosphoglycerate synthase